MCAAGFLASVVQTRTVLVPAAGVAALIVTLTGGEYVRFRWPYSWFPAPDCWRGSPPEGHASGADERRVLAVPTRYPSAGATRGPSRQPPDDGPGTTAGLSAANRSASHGRRTRERDTLIT